MLFSQQALFPAPVSPSAASLRLRRGGVIVSCSFCGKRTRKSPSQIRAYNYCTGTCYHKDRRNRTYKNRSDRGAKKAPRILRNCPQCGAETEVLKSAAKNHKRTFCSRSHLDQWLIANGGRLGGQPAAPIGATMRQNRGYILEKTTTGWLMQHRVRMEEALGRPLTAKENVHHINGIRDDNRLENLELWVRTQPSGQRVKDLLAFAREIIDQYGEVELEAEGHASLGC